MHIGDRLPESDHLITQGDEEVLETVGLPIHFRRSLRVAQRRPRPIRLVPARVALRYEHDRRSTDRLRLGEGLLHPQNVGSVARGPLRRA